MRRWGSLQENLSFSALCHQWQGEPRALDGEMLELRFFSHDEIDLSEISPPIRPVMAKLIQRYRMSNPNPLNTGKTDDWTADPSEAGGGLQGD